MKKDTRKPRHLGTGIHVHQQFNKNKLVKGDTFFDADFGEVKWNGEKWIEDTDFVRPVVGIKLVSKKLFRDYDISGIKNINRAKVPYRIKVGEIFNIYRGVSTKEGCKWMGNLQYSLVWHLFINSEL